KGINLMSIKFGACSAFAATLFGFALTTMPAHAYVEAGMLNCRSSGTAGYIVFSARTFDCIFIPSSGAPPQYYQGNVQRFGAQIGFTNDVALSWAVFAATSRVGPGALAGGYIGASAGAAVGVGVAANGLVGGLNNSFALQPISVEGQSGLNAIATVTGLGLRPVVPVGHHRRHRR
ncbi:MAG TPA: DUF992 domain-containing protein, partial [Pseudolabrys sp.]|nr:DUF992 domain-containing protein [Pseudolabrys sp.]